MKYDWKKWADFGLRYGVISGLIVLAVGTLLTTMLSLPGLPIGMAPILAFTGMVITLTAVVLFVICAIVDWIIAGWIFENILEGKLKHTLWELFASVYVAQLATIVALLGTSAILPTNVLDVAIKLIYGLVGFWVTLFIMRYIKWNPPVKVNLNKVI